MEVRPDILPPVANSQSPDMEAAYKLIEEDRLKRAEAFQKAIHEAQQRFNCVLDVELEKQGASFTARIVVVAR